MGGGEFNADSVKYWFGPETPFRFVAPGRGYHVLIIEELEYMNPTVQVLVKDAFERKLGMRKAIVVATSNDSTRLVKAVRHRFQHFYFSAGQDFAVAVNDWLPTVWAAEVGPGIDLPHGWQKFGWDGEEFSARLRWIRCRSSSCSTTGGGGGMRHQRRYLHGSMVGHDYWGDCWHLATVAGTPRRKTCPLVDNHGSPHRAIPRHQAAALLRTWRKVA